MRHEAPKRRDPNMMLSDALADGWQTVETLPLSGEGTFLALTLSGLIRLSRNRNKSHKSRRADQYGPKRSTVAAVDSGNYLAAIAWKWPEAEQA